MKNQTQNERVKEEIKKEDKRARIENRSLDLIN